MEKEGSARAFGLSAIVLTAMGVVAKFIGALYRVPLTNIIGAEGMGLYQMVFPLYTVLLAFCGGGMTSAVARVVAKYTALGERGTALRALKLATISLLAVGAVCVGGVAALSKVISSVQGNTDAAAAYLALCPSLLFVGGINVLRGYFQGKSQMLPSGISQLIEQLVKLVLGLRLGRIMLPYGVKYAVVGALIGVSASELCALIYLAARFAFAMRTRKRYVSIATPVAETSAELAAGIERQITDKTLMKELYSFALSVTLGALVLPITQMIDSVLVINLLIHDGAGREAATAMFGLMVGPVGALINMPTVVALSIAVAFLPTITRAVERGAGGARAARKATKWIMLFVIPVAATFLIFPDRICELLYRKGLTSAELETASRLLRVQAFSVFYMGVLQLSTAVLQGHNKAHVPVINLIIGACFKVGLTPLTVRAFGIVGASGASAVCYAVAALLSVRCACKCMPIGAEPKNAFVKPLALTVVAVVVFGSVIRLAEPLPELWQTVWAAAAFVVVYAVGIFVTGALDIKPAIVIFGKIRRKIFGRVA